MSIKKFSSELFSSLVEKAIQSPRGRQHWNVHDSYEDLCQRFFNAIGTDSYIRPHRHSLDPKSESLIAIKGLFALLTFNDEGAVQEVVRFGTEKYEGIEKYCVGVELTPGIWHTIIALKPNSILLEIKAGPFDPSVAKEPAHWAPEEHSAQAASYLHSLRNSILDR